MSLFPNLKEITNKILNERGSEAFLFEVGKVYLKNKKEYIERRKVGIVYCQRKDAEFVYFKGYIEALFDKLNTKGALFDNSEVKPVFLSDFYKITLDKTVIGYGGQAGNIFYAEIDLDEILENGSQAKADLWPKYPPQIEDLTLSIPEKTKIGEVMNTMIHSNKLISNVELKDTFKNSYTFTIWYQDKNKTLNDKEVEDIRKKLIRDVTTKFGVTIKD